MVYEVKIVHSNTVANAAKKLRRIAKEDGRVAIINKIMKLGKNRFRIYYKTHARKRG